VYFTRTQHYRPGRHTGSLTLEFVLNQTNLATLASTGSLEYSAYVVGILSAASGGFLPNDIYLHDAALTAEYNLIPEPSTVLLLASGLAGLGVAGRQRQRC